MTVAELSKLDSQAKVLVNYPYDHLQCEEGGC